MIWATQHLHPVPRVLGIVRPPIMEPWSCRRRVPVVRIGATAPTIWRSRRRGCRIPVTQGPEGHNSRASTRDSPTAVTDERLGQATGSASGEQRIIGSFDNGAVGTALGQANGIQAPDRSRQVIALCGDGGFNMLMCEFLTAVHHKLPVKTVVYKNPAFRLITLEAEPIGVPAWKQGIDFPNPDYIALARACGGAGFKAERPGELLDAIDEALKADGPAIVHCVVAADELPNVPHLEPETMGNFAKAKIKETILAVYRWATEHGDSAVARAVAAISYGVQRKGPDHGKSILRCPIVPTSLDSISGRCQRIRSRL